MQVTIRVYEPRDAAGVAEVFYRSVREVASADYTAGQVAAWAPRPVDAGQEHRRSGDGRLVLVAVGDEDQVAAFADLEPDGHIDRLYCAPEAAGQGIASRLYEAIEETARAHGISRLFTEASELARRFFERKGFTVLERQDMVLRGVPIHNYRMAKDLSQADPPSRRATGGGSTSTRSPRISDAAPVPSWDPVPRGRHPPGRHRALPVHTTPAARSCRPRQCF